MRSAALEMVRVGLTEKATLQQRLEGHEGTSSAVI